MNRHFTIGLFISLWILFGCNRAKDSFDSSKIDFIKSRVWNLFLPDTIMSSKLPSRTYSLYKAYFNHRPIFFIKDKFYLGSYDGYKDSCSFHHDTLLITESYYKSVIGPSSYITDTLFLGKITSINNDSLEIFRIEDKLFDIFLGAPNEFKTMRFYNDSLILRKKTIFKTISLSSGLCYGSCPKQAIEIDSIGNLHYFGIANVHKKGYYKGKVNNQSLDTIGHLLSAALINRDVFKLYRIPKDAQGTELVIILNNCDTITINGDAGNFNYRLCQLCFKLKNFIETVNLEKDDMNYQFLSHKYIE